MTGMTDDQIADARAAGYDTVMLKIHPPLVGNAREIDFTSMDERVDRVTARGLNVILAVLGWVGLGEGRFWDTDENGDKIPNRLDPFWPEAMDQIEWYFASVIDHYKADPRVVAFAPTWGIYGEAGFTSFAAGRSEHALARFNQWRHKQGLAQLDALPTRRVGPNTEFNRFIRFRYLYLEQQFDAMIRRLKQRAGATPVGMWQELYPVAGYLWNMVEVPGADFALYESCFPYQTNHHPERSLAETMGFRYRCNSADQYRDYYLPLLARKRGEGGRFMGCQLSNDYAVKNYGWTEEKADRVQFDRWEDEFGPHLKRLLDEPLESPKRDVLLVFPTYAAAALSDHASHACDAFLIDVLLRMYGCQMVRYGSPRLDKLSVAEMNRFRLIVIPDTAYLMRETYERLRRTKATVLITGCFARSLDGELVPFGQQREVDAATLQYFERPAGEVSVAAEHALTRDLADVPRGRPVRLAVDEAFGYKAAPKDVRILLRCGGDPLLSTRDGGRMVFIHGHVFAALCHNPDRKAPTLSGSADASANEVDMWGPYDSSHPQNAFGYLLMKNLLDHAGVDYRVREPQHRTFCTYLGDHLEQASISANIVYNNTDRAQTLMVRTPFRPMGYASNRVAGHYETRVGVAPFSYVALQPRRDVR
ncbi:hypothetical protein AMK68_03625 [candidate division KD3-62 bacterium DG_56]|uniref:Glycoside hydrolase family 42 N-terminal domain-containing protein n=1 Tax=candidate division KD3-62 bacterium DG_56 TaxID=1704032 RepID=A0A0S7XM85_9BACT|nr:MAG: hypothetical protein AMK68_03625 [candidate division KD3-62 bacterium DG_56]